MKQSTLILFTIIILSTLFGCEKKQKAGLEKIFPNEDFAVIDAKIDDKPAIGSFNFAYKNYSKKAEYPWCLKIAIELDSINLLENGLPTNEESAVANKLEDELLSEIKKITTAHYIGHLFNDGFLDVYIYLEKPEKVNAYLQAQTNKKNLIRGIGFEIQKDAAWSYAKDFFE
jgi:hypothetical protein